MKEFLLNLAFEYQNSYVKWCNNNPGYIMHNDSIRELVCRKLAEECDTIESIKAKRDEYLAKYEELKGTPNGFFVSYKLCNEILDKLENIN